MTRSGLLLSIAGVLAGTAALFIVLGTVFNLILVLVAIPFGIAAYFLWSQATGRLHRRIRQRVIERDSARQGSESGSRGGSRRGRRTNARRPRDPSTDLTMDRQDALQTLDLAPGADQGAIRRAYRHRVKAVHPDTEGGDMEEFRRVRAAYERLRAPTQGKG